MSDIRANIAAITCQTELLAALGVHMDLTEGPTRNMAKFPVKNVELGFGLTKRIDVYDDFTDMMGSETIAFVYEVNNSTPTRYLMRTSCPLVGVKFLGDFSTYENSAHHKANANRDVLYIGGAAPWCVVDLSLDATEVVGLAVGTFAKMFERFCLALHSELSDSLLAYHKDLGVPELRHRMTMAANKFKARQIARQKKFESEQASRCRAFQSHLIGGHDVLELLAVDETSTSYGVSDPVYSLHYMDDIDRPVSRAGYPAEHMRPTDAFATVAKATQAHTKSKRSNCIAWVWRTVNNISEPYLIFNPTVKIWELV